MELYNKEFVFFDWDNNLEGKKGFFADNIDDLKQNVKDNRVLWYGEICRSDNNNYPFKLIEEKGNSAHFRFCYYDPYYEFRKAYLEGKQLQFRNSEGDWEDVHGAPFFNKDEYRIKPKMWYVVLNDNGLSRTNSKHDDVMFEGTEEECVKWIEVREKFEDIMIAWEDGKTIQYNSGNGWEDCCDNKPAWDVTSEYRIKDECKGCMKYNSCTNKDGNRCRCYCTEVEYVPFDTVEGLINAWNNKYPQNKNAPKGTMPLIWIKHKEKNRVYLITDFLFEKYFKNDVGTEDEDFTLEELFNNYTFADGSIIGKVKESEE